MEYRHWLSGSRRRSNHQPRRGLRLLLLLPTTLANLMRRCGILPRYSFMHCVRYTSHYILGAILFQARTPKPQRSGTKRGLLQHPHQDNANCDNNVWRDGMPSPLPPTLLLFKQAAGGVLVPRKRRTLEMPGERFHIKYGTHAPHHVPCGPPWAYILESVFD